MTISEIAKMAGVSSAAVSRYLNGGSLSEEKKKVIKEVIDRTGYIPSEYARTLRTKKSFQIGVLVPKINSSTVSRIVSGVSSVLREQGYRLWLADTDNDSKLELEYLELFRVSQLDGVIFLASVVSKKHMEILKAMKIPVVIVGQHVPEFNCVFHDDYHAARDMMKVLLEDGCKKPGILYSIEKDAAVGQERTRGMEDAMREAGMDAAGVDRVESGFDIDAGKTSMTELLKKAPDIDGVFCSTDSQAVGAILALKEAGKRIPEDIRVCGLGNNEASDLIEPKLTTAHYYYRTSGIEAAQMLLSMIDQSENRGPVRQTMLGYQIMKRGTTRNE